MSRRVRILLGTVAVAVVAAILAIGLSQTGGGDQHTPKASDFDVQAALRAVSGAPAPLAALHAQAGQVLDGGGGAVQARLAALKGHPVVVNKWAHWCQPCRAEFPLLQQASVRFGKQVAFLGLDSGDGNGGAARDFLKTFPLIYPSYVDDSAKIATALGAGQYYPTTVFYDAGGRQAFVHQGVYTSQDRLDQDIAHYALGRP